jgi:hypothetical protein
MDESRSIFEQPLITGRTGSSGSRPILSGNGFFAQLTGFFKSNAPIFAASFESEDYNLINSSIHTINSSIYTLINELRNETETLLGTRITNITNIAIISPGFFDDDQKSVLGLTIQELGLNSITCDFTNSAIAATLYERHVQSHPNPIPQNHSLPSKHLFGPVTME